MPTTITSTATTATVPRTANTVRVDYKTQAQAVAYTVRPHSPTRRPAKKP